MRVYSYHLVCRWWPAQWVFVGGSFSHVGGGYLPRHHHANNDNGWDGTIEGRDVGMVHGCYSNDNEAGPSLVQRCGDGGDDDAGPPPPLLQRPGDGDDNDAGPSLFQRCGDGDDDDAGPSPPSETWGRRRQRRWPLPSFRDLGTVTTTTLAPPLFQRPGDGDNNDAGPSPFSGMRGW
jgi:hypothetical protein